jgi:plasmid stability protein
MKNVTINLDEEVARWARVWAARHDTSGGYPTRTEAHERSRDEQSHP